MSFLAEIHKREIDIIVDIFTVLPAHHGHDAPRVEALKDRAWNVAGMDFANILYLPVPDCQPAAGI